eukprot:403336241
MQNGGSNHKHAAANGYRKAVEEQAKYNKLSKEEKKELKERQDREKQDKREQKGFFYGWI